MAQDSGLPFDQERVAPVLAVFADVLVVAGACRLRAAEPLATLTARNAWVVSWRSLSRTTSCGSSGHLQRTDWSSTSQASRCRAGLPPVERRILGIENEVRVCCRRSAVV